MMCTGIEEIIPLAELFEAFLICAKLDKTRSFAVRALGLGALDRKHSWLDSIRLS